MAIWVQPLTASRFSGYLVTHVLLRHLKSNNNKINLIQFYLNRYLRITPTMMITIGFGATMLRYFGSGPEWTNSTIWFDGWCRKNWWVNSLYLHNFVNVENMVRPKTVTDPTEWTNPLVSAVSQPLLVFRGGHTTLFDITLPFDNVAQTSQVGHIPVQHASGHDYRCDVDSHHCEQLPCSPIFQQHCVSTQN